MIIDVSKTKEISDKLPSTPIILTPEQIREDMIWAEETRRETRYKFAMSEINSRDVYVDSLN